MFLKELAQGAAETNRAGLIITIIIISCDMEIGTWTPITEVFNPDVLRGKGYGNSCIAVFLINAEHAVCKAPSDRKAAAHGAKFQQLLACTHWCCQPSHNCSN